MPHFKNTWLPLIFLLSSAFYGCKKVIDVHLNNGTVQTVITGEVTNRPGPYLVTISKSVNFSADNIFPTVSGAFVVIAGNGVIDTLSETSPGTYATHKLIGKPGSSYVLYVSAEGQIYTAISTMPQPVRLDSLGLLSGRKDNIFPIAYFKDPAGIKNYYQFIEYANGKRFSNGKGNTIFDDRLSDGRNISNILYTDDSTDIKSGISLTVQMNCIDKPVYNYLLEFLQVSGGGRGFSGPAPTNPTSNISGGALGYFSAFSESSKTLVIP
jgi:uncharacterized membrane protein